MSKIDFFRLSEFKKAYFPKNRELLALIEEKMWKGSLSKVNAILTDNLEKLSDIELMILRDMIYTLNGELENSVDLTTSIIEKYPNEYVGYLFQSITYFLMGRLKEAIAIADLGLSKSFDVLLVSQKAQILINYDHDKALKTIEEVIEDYPNNFALLRAKFLGVMTDKECCIKNIDTPEELINSLIEKYPKDNELKLLKGLLYIVTHKYREAKTWVKENMKPDISEHNPRIDIATYLIRTFSYLARGKFDKALKYVRIAEFHYPNHPLTHMMLGLTHGYNLVYNFDPEKANKDLFLQGIEKGISLQQSEKKLSRYYQLKSYILSETDGLEEALKAINKAIELSPEHYDIYATRTHLYLTYPERLDEVLELFDELFEKFPHEGKEIRQLKSFTFYAAGKTEEGVKLLEESLKKYPDSIGMLNNLALFHSNLGNFEKGKELIEKAIKIDPNEANLIDSYGEILMFAEEYEAAIVKFTQALEMNPTAWFAFHTFLKLAKCYRALGMDDKASTCHAKAKELTKKVIPGKRKIYLEELEESIDELSKLPVV
jgi:tetratricopeptide (TPR) repeat protein